MEFRYPNDHLEDHEVDGHVTRPDAGLEITDHVSIPTGSMPDKIPPQDHSDSFDDEGKSINPKDDTEGKETEANGKQDIVCGRIKCYNGSAQLVQLKQTPHHREKS